MRTKTTRMSQICVFNNERDKFFVCFAHDPFSFFIHCGAIHVLSMT